MYVIISHKKKKKSSKPLYFVFQENFCHLWICQMVMVNALVKWKSFGIICITILSPVDLTNAFGTKEGFDESLYVSLFLFFSSFFFFFFFFFHTRLG